MQAQAPSPDAFLLVGLIVAPFGVRGQVKLRAITDRPEHLTRVKTIYLGDARSATQLTQLFEHKPGLLVLSLKDVTTREAADDLRGTEVYIHEKDALPLDEDEYYLHQLYDLQVETVAGETLGRVREVLETGANEVLVVARPGQADALIPMTREVVQQLDIAGGRIVIQPLPGLLDS
jgi:16S rRNA processing protein RimM